MATIKVVLSGGPFGGQVREIQNCKPGEEFESDGCRYRRDSLDPELANFTADLRPAEAPPSRVAAVLAARPTE